MNPAYVRFIDSAGRALIVDARKVSAVSDTAGETAVLVDGLWLHIASKVDVVVDKLANAIRGAP